PYMLRCQGTNHPSVRKPIVPARSLHLDPSTDEGIRSRTGTDGKLFSCSMGEEDRERHRASQTAGIMLRSSRGWKYRCCSMNLLLQSELVKYGPTSQADSHGFCHAGPKLDPRAENTKKGTSAESRNPFLILHGAEGGI
ncbi:hypothetical protein, partial [Candidatus Deferrimicrobium sp.]|uniref:hypothetical protein n=1 Tax=Candidatus Deferrimicrobium sp. TaxID=3060586 RepID=UPI003C396CB3